MAVQVTSLADARSIFSVDAMGAVKAALLRGEGGLAFAAREGLLTSG
jgi:hypothetical protein